MTVIGGYELLGAVGSGATGTVWKARDIRLDRHVALKRLDDPTDELRARWRAEARVLAQLEERHVVAVYEYLEDDADAYIVEEWVDGATLAAVLSAHGTLAADQALGVLRGALLGLAHAHSRGVVHRDVSAGNILVDLDGVSRLIDFGHAAPAGAGGESGTSAYRSPEVDAGGPVTAASDVYSAAAVLTHLLTGVAQTPPAADRVDAGLRDVIRRALETSPEARYPDAAAFLAALEEAAERRYGAAWWTEAGMAALVSASGATAVAHAGSGRTRRPKAPRRGLKVPVIAAGAAVVTAAVAVAALASRSDEDRPAASSPPTSASAAALPSAAPSTSAAASPTVAAAVPLLSASSPVSSRSTASPSSASSLPAAVVDAVPAAARVRGTYKVSAVFTVMGARIVKSVANTTFVGVGDNVGYGDWTIEPTCTRPTSCTAKVTSTDGLGYNLVFEDGHWRGRSPVQTLPCAGSDKSSAAQIDVDFVDPSRPDSTTPPATFSGKTAHTYHGNCGPNTGGKAQTTLVLSRITF